MRHALAILVLLLAPTLARASHQSLVLSACVPQASTAGLVTSACSTSGCGTTGGNAGITFAPDNTGTFVVRCNIVNENDAGCTLAMNWTTISLTTSDRTTATSCTARLFKLPIGSSITSQVGFVTSTDSSVVHADTGTVSETFDFCTNAYYVAVSCSRTSTSPSLNIAAYAVQLQ